MASVGLPAPDWWNFKPLAEEIHVDCYQGRYIDIDFTKYLIQGANPTTERVLMGLDPFLDPHLADTLKLSTTGSQRGFLNAVRVTSDPVHGTYYTNIDHGIVRYVPFERFLGIDCFRYVITTSWQSSDQYRVMIRVLEAPRVSIYVHRFIGDRNAFSYEARVIGVGNSQAFPAKKYRYFLWYEFIPTLSVVDGRPEVVMVPKAFHEPTIAVDISHRSFLITDDGHRTPWVFRYWPDAKVDGKGYLPNTDTVYKQPAGPYNLLVRCVLFDDIEVMQDGNLNYINADELWTDTLQGGFSWWRTGQQVIFHDSM